MSDYEKLKDFWDSFYGDIKIEKVSKRFINDEVFNSMIDEHLEDGFKVLDYGCGSGWAIFELNLAKKLAEGVGIETSSKAIEYCKKVAEKSKFNNLTFLNGNEELLRDYRNYFDFCISVNTLDVLPNEITLSIIENIKNSLKKNGIFVLCINHDFTEKQLTDLLGMEKHENLYYKDGILRCNLKSKDEWISLFKNDFEFIKYDKFIVADYEKPYPRQMFIFKKK